MLKTEFKSRKCSFSPRIVSAAVLLAILGTVPNLGCSKADNHAPVHPVVGVIQFRGQPVEGAFVSLIPKSPVDKVPNPRATVAKDGTFTVSTYNGNDARPRAIMLSLSSGTNRFGKAPI